MSFTAKSVIFDIADSYEVSSSYVGIRAIDFWFESSKITIAAADITGYATTTTTGNDAWRAFDTSLSKTGDYAGNGWLSSSSNRTDQRLIVVFDTAQTFDAIKVTNFHINGTSHDIGAKNVVINISSDTITSTTYEATITNSTEIFDGVFLRNTTGAIEDDLTLTLPEPAVSTDAATSVEKTTATLNGELTSLGAESSVDVFFEYGETAGYGLDTTPETLSATGTFDAALTDLSDGTEYHFRAAVTDSVDTWYGTDTTFTTEVIQKITFSFPSMSLDMLQTEGFTNPTGVASAELPSIELSLVGGASISSQFPSLQADAAGVAGHAGSIAASFPKLSLHAYAGSRIYTSLPALSLGMTAISNTIADISAQMPVLGCSIVASIASEGDIDVLFPKLTAAMEATIGIVGTISGTLPKFSMGITALPGTIGDLEGTFRLPRLSAAGGPSGPGEIDAVFPMLDLELTSGEIDSDVLRYDWERIA